MTVDNVLRQDAVAGVNPFSLLYNAESGSDADTASYHGPTAMLYYH